VCDGQTDRQTDGYGVAESRSAPLCCAAGAQQKWSNVTIQPSLYIHCRMKLSHCFQTTEMIFNRDSKGHKDHVTFY